MNAAYEEEDELLWSPGSLPESKVRGFLSEVSSRTGDDKAGCDKPGVHVRDNERVSNVHPNDADIVARSKDWDCKTLCVFLVLEVS